MKWRALIDHANDVHLSIDAIFVRVDTWEYVVKDFFLSFLRLNFLCSLSFDVDSYPIFLREIWKIIYNEGKESSIKYDNGS